MSLHLSIDETTVDFKAPDAATDLVSNGQPVPATDVTDEDHARAHRIELARILSRVAEQVGAGHENGEVFGASGERVAEWHLSE